MIWNQGHLPDNWTVNTLLKNHSSRPYNPDIANAFFRSGYIEAWGRGIRKMIELCLENKQPKPSFEFEGSDFWVIFRKDIFTKDQLEKLGLNERQIRAVLFAKAKGRITNSDYQRINNCSRNTATKDLSDLIKKKLIKSSGKSGAGSFYTLS